MPFQVWCVDSLPNMTPEAPGGGTTVLIAIDAFSKWMEINYIKEHDSYHTAAWFHEHILCRYGTPSVVRSDQGIEY